jgi:D-sedoheptulose 7-phosphate isomerase
LQLNPISDVGKWKKYFVCTMKRIKEVISKSIEIKEKILQDKDLVQTIEAVVDICSTALCEGNKILFCGNGGSAADAQHLAAELSGRFYLDREPLDAEALHVNTSYLTAVANDYGYDQVFSRMVKAKGRKGDVLIGLTTSGNSENILHAFYEANSLGMITVAFTGESGGKLREASDFLINVPSRDTPRIQEAHIMIGHIVCELIEYKIFS